MPTSFTSPITLDLAAQQQALAHRQALAQMLIERGLTPDQGQMISGHYVGPGAFQALARVLTGGAGLQMQRQGDEQSLALAREGSQRMMNNWDQQFVGGSPQTSTQGIAHAIAGPANGAGATVGDAPNIPGNARGLDPAAAIPPPVGAPQLPQAAPTQSSGVAPPSSGIDPRREALKRAATHAWLGGNIEGANATMKMYNEWDQRTEMEKQNAYLGIGAPEAAQYERAKRHKEGFIEPINARPNTILRNAETGQPFAVNPEFPPGGTPIFDASGNVTGFKELPGYTALTQQQARSKKAGEQQEMPPPPASTAGGTPGNLVGVSDYDRIHNTPAYQQAIGLKPPTKPLVDQPQPSQQLGNQPQPSTPAFRSKDRIGPEPISPNSITMTVPGGGTLIRSGPDPGITASADAKVKWIVDDYAKRQERSAQSPMVVGNLQRIYDLASQTITGAHSDVPTFINGLMAFIGSNDKATKATDARQLIDKYQADIIRLLGGGSSGSDAFRGIIGHAFPGNEMNLGALRDAAANQMAKERIFMAETNHLLPSAQGTNYNNYTNKIKELRDLDPNVVQHVFKVLSLPKDQYLKATIDMSDQEWTRFKRNATLLHDGGIDMPQPK